MKLRKVQKKLFVKQNLQHGTHFFTPIKNELKEVSAILDAIATTIGKCCVHLKNKK